MYVVVVVVVCDTNSSWLLRYMALKLNKRETGHNASAIYFGNYSYIHIAVLRNSFFLVL